MMMDLKSNTDTEKKEKNGRLKREQKRDQGRERDK
jgi:hypothetical protein